MRESRQRDAALIQTSARRPKNETQENRRDQIAAGEYFAYDRVG